MGTEPYGHGCSRRVRQTLGWTVEVPAAHAEPTTLAVYHTSRGHIEIIPDQLEILQAFQGCGRPTTCTAPVQLVSKDEVLPVEQPSAAPTQLQARTEGQAVTEGHLITVLEGE